MHACSNYSNPNAGSAGETGCLLINEQSRWSWVGGELRVHQQAGQVVRASLTPGPSNKQNTLVGSACAVFCVWSLAREEKTRDCERSRVEDRFDQGNFKQKNKQVKEV